MGPEKPLPFSDDFENADHYVDSLLKFGTSSALLQTLCGGIHILDFFTRDPEIYQLILPESWREWFKSKDIFELLNLFCREDLSKYATDGDIKGTVVDNGSHNAPPADFIEYLTNVRKHCLLRNYTSKLKSDARHSLTRHTSVGMKPKKAHEVDNFARYVDQITKDLSSTSNTPISHLVDFGAGQNPLGRALASTPYNQHVIAIESRPHVVELARKMDILAKVVDKPIVMVDKRKFRAAVAAGECAPVDKGNMGSQNPYYTTENGSSVITQNYMDTVRANLEKPKHGRGSVQYVGHNIQDGDLSAVIDQIVDDPVDRDVAGNNTDADATKSYSQKPDQDPALLVMSLHSCGNLSHHGLRTITLNKSVRAIAIVGCCYNLMTERLGPPTYKLPELRPNHPRLEATSSAFDPHGFPMSASFAEYKHKLLKRWQSKPTPQVISHTTDTANDDARILDGTCHSCDSVSQVNGISEEHDYETGIRLNITSRMMAVQAPDNWTEVESDGFFTRHFYRALLQKIFLDKGIVAPPTQKADDEGGYVPGEGRSPAGTGMSTVGGTDPIIIGTLGKKCYLDFVSYVRGATAKIAGQRKASDSSSTDKIGATTISNDPHPQKLVKPTTAALIAERVATMTNEEINEYYSRFLPRKKDLSIIWSLMAVSAGVIESMIVVDRWLWLKEQKDIVKDAWVESVFDYKLSPRNLVVVGIRK